MFQRYDEGATMTAIRDWLNEQGVKNTRGQKMTYNSIQHLLNNRRYIGEYTYRDIVVPDGIPAIVPQDLFDRVQEKLAKNKKTPARHKAEDDYLLTTKLFCGYCGAYLCVESGTSHTGNVHHYYKCVSVKKKRTECHKKSVRKEWIEDLVVNETMKMVMDDTAIEAIVSMLMDLQDRENVNLPLYEQQLRKADTAIQNLLNAIQQGILTKSTKGRLEELEATKEELETKIACEKLAKPKVSAEFMTFWLHRFRKLDVRQKSHRKILIDTFINAIFLYDDKMVITFNYKDGTDTITFDDLKTALADKNTGSDLDCSTAPEVSKDARFRKGILMVSLEDALFAGLAGLVSQKTPLRRRRLRRVHPDPDAGGHGAVRRAIGPQNRLPEAEGAVQLAPLILDVLDLGGQPPAVLGQRDPLRTDGIDALVPPHGGAPLPHPGPGGPALGPFGVEKPVLPAPPNQVGLRDEPGHEGRSRRRIDLRGGPDLLDPPAVHHHDPVGQGHGLLLIVGDVDKGRAMLSVQRGDLLPHLDPKLRVQSRERLVHQQDSGVSGNSPGEGYALSLPSGEMCRVPVRQGVEPHGPEDSHGLVPAAPPPPVLQGEEDVLRHRHVGPQGEGLKDHPDPAGLGRQPEIRRRDHPAVEEHRARSRFFEARQQA